MTLNEKAAALLQQTEVVVLSSVQPEGYPRPVPMSKIKSEGISVVWMATGRHSQKTRDFRKDAKAGLCFYRDGNSVALTGKVEIVTDESLKKELWQDWFIGHFPQGPTDPEYILLKFTASHATYWLDGRFVHKAV